MWRIRFRLGFSAPCPILALRQSCGLVAGTVTIDKAVGQLLEELLMKELLGK